MMRQIIVKTDITVLGEKFTANMEKITNGIGEDYFVWFISRNCEYMVSRPSLQNAIEELEKTITSDRKASFLQAQPQWKEFLRIVKQIYWKHAKGNVFSNETDWELTRLLPEDSLETIYKPYVDLEDNIPICLHVEDNFIAFDGAVYEALNYGFQEGDCYIEPQMSNFLDALEKSFPEYNFELEDLSLIHWFPS